MLDPFDTGAFLFPALLGLLRCLALDMPGNQLDAEQKAAGAG